jgi:small-conductance mechanosensitive channel
MSDLENPFKVGDTVEFAPDERTIGWTWSSFDRLRIHPGDKGIVTKIVGRCIFIDDGRGGFDWECFRKLG